MTDHAAGVPKVLAQTAQLVAETDSDAAGAVWKLQEPDRDLDSNVIALPPAGTIDQHTGPDLDVLIHVLSGTGTLHTAEADIDLAPGGLIWLPKRSRRGFSAGRSGLRYLTVHRKRQALNLQPPSR